MPIQILLIISKKNAINLIKLFRFFSCFQTEDAALPTKDSEGLEKKKEFGSNLSLSTASSFERIPDQQL